MTPRLLRDVLILMMLALLPPAVAGCAARADGGYKPVPHQPPTVGTVMLQKSLSARTRHSLQLYSTSRL